MFAKRITIHLFSLLFFASVRLYTKGKKYYVDINFADRAFELSHVSRIERKLENMNRDTVSKRERERGERHGCKTRMGERIERERKKKKKTTES